MAEEPACKTPVGRNNLIRQSTHAPFPRRWRTRSDQKAIAMMQTTKHRNANDLRPHGWSWRSQMACAIGRLHAKTAMGTAMVVADVLVDDPFCVSPAPDDDVVETVPTQRSDSALAKCVRRGRPR